MTDDDHARLVADLTRLHATLEAVITAREDDPALRDIRIRLHAFLDQHNLLACRRCSLIRKRNNDDEPRHYDPATCTYAAKPWHQDITPIPATITDQDLIDILAAVRAISPIPPPLTPQQKHDRETRGLERLMREAPAHRRSTEVDK